MLAGLQRAAQQGTVGQSSPGCPSTPCPRLCSAGWLWAGPEGTLLQTVIERPVAQAWAVMLAGRTVGLTGVPRRPAVGVVSGRTGGLQLTYFSP